MSTKDCIAALNAHLNEGATPYEGNRKFKRTSKKKNADGQVVRLFADDLGTFQVIGDGPFQVVEHGRTAPTPPPAQAVARTLAAPDPSDPFGALFDDSEPYAPETIATPGQGIDPCPGRPMGKGWYFALGGPDSEIVEQDWQEGVQCGFHLVPKEYYDREGCIQCVHVATQFALPGEFLEIAEATFLSWWPLETTRKWLLDNGFETTAELEAMVNGED